MPNEKTLRSTTQQKKKMPEKSEKGEKSEKDPKETKSTKKEIFSPKRKDNKDEKSQIIDKSHYSKIRKSLSVHLMNTGEEGKTQEILNEVTDSVTIFKIIEELYVKNKHKHHFKRIADQCGLNKISIPHKDVFYDMTEERIVSTFRPLSLEDVLDDACDPPPETVNEPVSEDMQFDDLFEEIEGELTNPHPDQGLVSESIGEDILFDKSHQDIQTQADVLRSNKSQDTEDDILTVNIERQNTAGINQIDRIINKLDQHADVLQTNQQNLDEKQTMNINLLIETNTKILKLEELVLELTATLSRADNHTKQLTETLEKELLLRQQEITAKPMPMQITPTVPQPVSTPQAQPPVIRTNVQNLMSLAKKRPT